MGGDWCAARIRELLRHGTSEGQLREIPVTFNGQERADRRALLAGIGHHLGVKPVQDLQSFSQRVVQTLCDSLQNGSVVMIQCENCDYLSSYEPEIFHWMLEDFWQLMVCKLSAVAKQYYGVKVLLLLFVDGPLQEHCLPSGHCCTLERVESDGFEKEKLQKLLRIPLKPWTREDIREWIVNHSGQQKLSRTQVDVIANKIYGSTQNGLPSLVANALLKEFCPKAAG